MLSGSTILLGGCIGPVEERLFLIALMGRGGEGEERRGEERKGGTGEEGRGEREREEGLMLICTTVTYHNSVL